MSADDPCWKEDTVLCGFLPGPVQKWCPQISCLLRVTSCFKWSKLIWASNSIFKCSLFHDCNTYFSGCVNDDYIQLGQNSKKSSKRKYPWRVEKAWKKSILTARKHQYYRKKCGFFRPTNKKYDNTQKLLLSFVKREEIYRWLNTFG